MQSPFDLNSTKGYQEWRSKKILGASKYITKHTPLPFVQFSDCTTPSNKELKTMIERCNTHSFCLYRINDIKVENPKDIILYLASRLGLNNLDKNICADPDQLTSITKTSHKGQHEYIPYSNKRLSWHTDGYYNTPETRINSMLLHCEQPAKEGGQSLLMDHEIMYILLRDENPEYITALMEDDAMTIPANILNGKIIREAQTGPVFSINKQGQLHMRYSARKRYIEWKSSPPILEALQFIEEHFKSESPYIIKYTLQAGEGLICRNILHCRTAFVDYDDDTKKRLLYRGRYYDYLVKEY